MSVTIGTAAANGFTMNYFSFGTGERPLVIIPGISIKSVMESAEFVARAYDMFSEHYTVYVLDRRTELPEKYTVDEMGADTAAVMDSLGLRDAYIIGVSQGGCIAQIIAARRPGLVKKMALESTISRLCPESEKVVNEWVELAKKHDKDGLNLVFAKGIYTDSYFERYKDAITVMSRLYTYEELDRFVILAESMSGYTVYDELGKVNCPVLVIGGSEDRIFSPSCFKETAEKLHGELHIFEGYGHACYDEAPEAKQLIFEFFERDR
ncbi:MAG: alpha/beta hydrolase [Ruminiclostridium sp.]|nr:alpha/beta hydrolase [Ruminiclostridium sp.]